MQDNTSIYTVKIVRVRLKIMLYQSSRTASVSPGFKPNWNRLGLVERMGLYELFRSTLASSFSCLELTMNSIADGTAVLYSYLKHYLSVASLLSGALPIFYHLCDRFRLRFLLPGFGDDFCDG